MEEEQHKPQYNVDLNFLKELEMEDKDYNETFNFINKDFIEQQNLKKLETAKKEGTADEDFELQALEDIVK